MPASSQISPSLVPPSSVPLSVSSEPLQLMDSLTPPASGLPSISILHPEHSDLVIEVMGATSDATSDPTSDPTSDATSEATEDAVRRRNLIRKLRYLSAYTLLSTFLNLFIDVVINSEFDGNSGNPNNYPSPIFSFFNIIFGVGLSASFFFMSCCGGECDRKFKCANFMALWFCVPVGVYFMAMAALMTFQNGVWASRRQEDNGDNCDRCDPTGTSNGVSNGGESWIFEDVCGRNGWEGDRWTDYCNSMIADSRDRAVVGIVQGCLMFVCLFAYFLGTYWGCSIRVASVCACCYGVPYDQR